MPASNPKKTKTSPKTTKLNPKITKLNPKMTELTARTSSTKSTLRNPETKFVDEDGCTRAGIQKLLEIAPSGVASGSYVTRTPEGESVLYQERLCIPERKQHDEDTMPTIQFPRLSEEDRKRARRIEKRQEDFLPGIACLLDPFNRTNEIKNCTFSRIVYPDVLIPIESDYLFVSNTIFIHQSAYTNTFYSEDRAYFIKYGPRAKRVLLHKDALLKYPPQTVVEWAHVSKGDHFVQYVLQYLRRTKLVAPRIVITEYMMYMMTKEGPAQGAVDTVVCLLRKDDFAGERVARAFPNSNVYFMKAMKPKGPDKPTKSTSLEHMTFKYPMEVTVCKNARKSAHWGKLRDCVSIKFTRYNGDVLVELIEQVLDDKISKNETDISYTIKKEDMEEYCAKIGKYFLNKKLVPKEEDVRIWGSVWSALLLIHEESITVRKLKRDAYLLF